MLDGIKCLLEFSLNIYHSSANMPANQQIPTSSQLKRYKDDLKLDFPELELGLIDFMLFLYKQKTLHSTKANNEKVCDST